MNAIFSRKMAECNNHSGRLSRQGQTVHWTKKMMTLSCKDGGVDFDFVAKGESEQEVMDQATEHVKKEHSEKMEEMLKTMSKEQITSMMKSMIKTT